MGSIFSFRNERGLFPNPYGAKMESCKNGKIVVFGLPKAGNVWLVGLLSAYTGLPALDPVANQGGRGVGMCHLPFWEPFKGRSDFLHGVYLLRDIRDIMVSRFHYCQTPYFADVVKSFRYPTIRSFYYDHFLSVYCHRYKIDTAAECYADLGIPIIRYESMCEDTAVEFGRLILRLGLPYDQTRIDTVVRNHEFARLKHSGVQLDVKVPPSHFRRGSPGAAFEELPQDILDHMNERFRPFLRRWGYL